MVTSQKLSRLLLGLIITAHLTLGACYALLTPKWQNPDEPAHYSFVQYVAARDELPVLQMGDYPGQYLEEIKAAHFPEHMSIAPIRYESWQPPLYYSLAAVVYRLTLGLGFDGQFAALRLFSVLLGAVVIWAIHGLVQEICPGQEALALSASAFVATLPMHLAMSAAISNDTLAELLLTLVVWQSLRIVRRGIRIERTLISGTLLGLSLLTKTTIYVGVPVVGAAMLLGRLQDERPASPKGDWIRHFVVALSVALLYGGPWFWRNSLVYGNLDLLAWQRHDAVVFGQLRTSELIDRVGFSGLVRDLILTTFRSFWAQFGWMGVLVDQRIYLGLALLSSLLVLGFVLYLLRIGGALSWRMIQNAPLLLASRHAPLARQTEGADSALVSTYRLTSDQIGAGAVLAFSGLLTVSLYLFYNLKFVQHQGRYLFPALGAISFAAALGLRELLRPQTARLVALWLLLASGLLLLIGALTKDISVWVLALLLLGFVWTAAAAWLPERWRWIAPALLYSGLLALDVTCLLVFIVPALAV